MLHLLIEFETKIYNVIRFWGGNTKKFGKVPTMMYTYVLSLAIQCRIMLIYIGNPSPMIGQRNHQKIVH